MKVSYDIDWAPHPDDQVLDPERLAGFVAEATGFHGTVHVAMRMGQTHREQLAQLRAENIALKAQLAGRMPA